MKKTIWVKSYVTSDNIMILIQIMPKLSFLEIVILVQVDLSVDFSNPDYIFEAKKKKHTFFSGALLRRNIPLISILNFIEN